VTGLPAGAVAIDGGTVRRSGCERDDKAPIHMVSAFAARPRLVLGQVKVAGKSDEVTAIPRLPTTPAIEGAIATIDAMGEAGQRFRQAQPGGMARRGCQRESAQKLLDERADHVLAPKANRGSLRADIELFAAEPKARDFSDTKAARDTTVDGGHGRVETRTTTVIHDGEWLQQRHDWPGLEAVAMVESRREASVKTEHGTRLHLTSLVMIAALVGPVARRHRAIENSLHRVIDMMFRDDGCRVRTEHAPANLTTVKHMARSLLRTAASKDAPRPRRKVAAWDDDFLAALVAR